MQNNLWSLTHLDRNSRPENDLPIIENNPLAQNEIFDQLAFAQKGSLASHLNRFGGLANIIPIALLGLHLAKGTNSNHELIGYNCRWPDQHWKQHSSYSGDGNGDEFQCHCNQFLVLTKRSFVFLRFSIVIVTIHSVFLGRSCGPEI